METQVGKKEAQPRLRDLSKAFAKRIVRLNQYLTQQIEPREEILSFGLMLTLSSGLLLTSCYQSPVVEEVSKEGQMVDVQVSLAGLDITQAESRASDKSATEAKLTQISFKAFDAEGNAKSEITQSSTDEGFGSLSFRLPVGTYTFVAVANDATTATITSATQATLGEYQNLILYSKALTEVAIAGNGSQEVEMDMGKRRNAAFRVKITDDTPTDVEAIQLIVSPSASAPSEFSFSPATGLASSTWRYERTYSKTAYNFTTFTGKGLTFLFLLSSAEQQIDVTINALSTTGEVLYTRTLEGVTFRQAYQTTATGTFFSAATAGSMMFDTTLTNEEIALDPDEE